MGGYPPIDEFYGRVAKTRNLQNRLHCFLFNRFWNFYTIDMYLKMWNNRLNYWQLRGRCPKDKTTIFWCISKITFILESKEIFWKTDSGKEVMLRLLKKKTKSKENTKTETGTVQVLYVSVHKKTWTMQDFL